MKRGTGLLTSCILLAILSILAALAMLQQRSANILLDKIALVRPGICLRTIAKDLGPKLQEIDNVDYMIRIGPIRNPAFCQGKKLFIFHASSPPCRAIAVYTDSNDMVVYTAWQKL